VGDLGKGAMGAIISIQEKLFDFSLEKRMKNEFILPQMCLKKWFFPIIVPPLQILDPPLPDCAQRVTDGMRKYGLGSCSNSYVT
jgi:hypothetical protein